MPFIVVALIIRTIDALKAFDTIYVITQGGPGSASETINIFLYLQAFAFYNMGYASAVVVVFFAIIMALAALLLWTRQRVRLGHEDAPRGASPRRTRLGSASPVVCRAGLAGGAGLPVDALALAQERARQHRLAAGLHPRPADARQLPRGLRAQRLPALRLEQRGGVLLRHLPRARWSASRPATASPRCGRSAPRR